MRALRAWIAVAVAFSAAWALGAAPLEGRWSAVRIEPKRIVLAGPGASQKLVVTLTAHDGGEVDAAGRCKLSSSDTDVIAVEGDRVLGRGTGVAELSAHCGSVSASEPVRVGDQAVEMEISFVRDVASILTTKGCNGSACHGSPAGQNGFKLSLYGSDPAADREMIVSAHEGRRVSFDHPEESLLLAKPTFQIAHGGGQLMTVEADAYRTMLSWIEQGAKLSSGGARLESLEMVPAERALVGEGARQPVAVIGRLSDGSTRDMTGEVRFTTLDEAVVSAVADGAVASRGRGLTTVTARAMGKVAVSQFIAIERRANADYSSPAPNNFIDQQIFRTLRDVNVVPYETSSDRVFVRRVFLDAIGVLPTPDEAEAFVADSRADKRERVIDSLLDRDDYALHWLVKFEDWFRNSQYYSQGRTNGSYKRWLHEFIREDRPYDEAVREMITAVGDTTVRPAGNFWHPAIDFMLKKFEVEKAVPTLTRLFLGKRIECAQCHNHPLENLTQDDFYGMAAFLGRMKVKHGYGQYRRIWYNTRSGEVLHPTTKEPVAPKFLEGERPEIPDGVDRRTVLADWITREQKLQFARATVNRVWYEYFGRGIVEPFDDFRSTNRATHPELLDQLAEHFIACGFRFKSLHRLILNSKTYQLAAHTADRPGGEDPLEEMLFARYNPRKLPAEVLLDAVVRVTGKPEEFRNYPLGTSPKELIASVGATYFLTTFGHPRRDVMGARTQAPSLSQALHLMNGETLSDKVAASDNVLGRLIGEGLDDRACVDEIYLRAYSRRPTAAQWMRLSAYLESERAAGRDRRRALESVLWAVLNSKEFQLNH